MAVPGEAAAGTSGVGAGPGEVTSAPQTTRPRVSPLLAPPTGGAVVLGGMRVSHLSSPRPSLFSTSPTLALLPWRWGDGENGQGLCGGRRAERDGSADTMATPWRGAREQTQPLMDLENEREGERKRDREG